MKYIIIIAWVLLGMTGRGQETEGFHIIGNLGGSLGGFLVLVGSGPEGVVKLGETEMVNGNFEFRGKVNGLMLAYILTDQKQPIATLMLENRSFKLKAGSTGIVVEGGELQRVWNEFEAVNREISRQKFQVEQQAKAAYAVQNQLQLRELQDDFDEFMKQIHQKQDSLLETNKETPAAACFVASVMDQLDYKGVTELYSMLGETAKSSFFGQLIRQRLARLRNLEVGGTVPDFKAATINGDTVSLYATQAKVKLVDFWASWCVPCRQEMPMLRKIYEKYHQKGLEIISFSLDTQKQDWAKAVRDDKITWPNISDLKGSESGIVSALYFVRDIPYTLLLDENNRVIAKGLRGNDLRKKVAALLEKK